MNKNIPLIVSIVLNLLLISFILMIMFAPKNTFIPTDAITLNSSGSRLCNYVKKNNIGALTEEEKIKREEMCKNFK